MAKHINKGPCTAYDSVNDECEFGHEEEWICGEDCLTADKEEDILTMDMFLIGPPTIRHTLVY